MTQEITVVPVDARTADWPRKVATVLNRLQNTTALAGGSAAWGGITGTLSAQTDLQTALNAKQATLVSGTNIKTVNSTTLLGSGNLAVGTVTSVGLTVPTGLSIAGSPVTSSGTLAITFTSGYSIPTDAAQTNWNTAFGWGNHASAGYQPGDAQLTSLAGLSFTGNALKVVRVNAGETDFELATASGSGTVTTTGSPASGNLTKFSGATSITNGDLSGDVTTSGTLAVTIANDAVTYAKMQNVSATSRILGRKTASAGDPEECTLSEILDFVGSAAQGDILYRGSSSWTRLGAGTSGQALTTRGSGANPVWAYPDLGPAWTDITWAGSSTYFGGTRHKSSQSFTLAAGQKIEVEGYVYKTQGSDGELCVGDDSAGTAYQVRSQGDDNTVLYRFNGGAATSLSATGTNSTYDFTGVYYFKLVVNVHAASNNFLYAVHNDQKLPTTPHINNTTFTMVGTFNIYIITNDSTKCYVRARVLG